MFLQTVVTKMMCFQSVVALKLLLKLRVFQTVVIKEVVVFITS